MLESQLQAIEPLQEDERRFSLAVAPVAGDSRDDRALEPILAQLRSLT